MITPINKLSNFLKLTIKFKWQSEFKNTNVVTVKKTVSVCDAWANAPTHHKIFNGERSGFRDHTGDIHVGDVTERKRQEIKF